MELEKAKSIAETLVAEMLPYSEKILIAGSIRRGKADVKDIEILVQPEYVERKVYTGNLFEPVKVEPVNRLHIWAESQKSVRWIKTGTKAIIDRRPKADGKYWRGIIEADGEQIKLDLFLAEKDNFGVIEVIRTGPAAFSMAMVAFIKHQTPFRVADGHLTVEATGEIIPCETEFEFFRNAGLKFVSIENRCDENPYKFLVKE